MPQLNKTESRLPEVFGEATATTAVNYFNAQNAALLGYNYFSGDYCLVSYLPASLHGIGDIGSLENTYVVFVNAAVTTNFDYAWTVTYRLDNASDVTYAATTAENAAIFVLNAIDKGLSKSQLSHLTRMEVTCKVSQGSTTVATLKLSHNLSATEADIAALYAADSDSKVAKGGNAQTTYIAANLMRGNFPTAPTWYDKNTADPTASPTATSWEETTSAPQLNHPLAVLYARLLKAKGDDWFPEFNQAYHDGLNNGDLELFRRDTDNHVGPCAIAPHFAAMALGKTTFQRLGGSIKESAIFTAFQALPENDRIDLYNLARFPKSAFTLCARVLQKLLESAKTNNYAQFLGSTANKTAWKANTATALKDDTFIKSLVFEYLNGPQQDIGGLEYTLGLLRFNQILKRTHKHDWSGYVTTILDYQMFTTLVKVEQAYFARRKVSERATGGYDVSFERINDSMLGREEYVLIETEGLQGNTLRLQVKMGADGMTLKAGEALELAPNAAGTNEFVSNVNDPNNLLDDEGQAFGNAANWANYAIFKLALRHPTEATFTAWNAAIPANGSANPSLVLDVNVKDAAPEVGVQYGSGSSIVLAAETPYTFLDDDEKFAIAHLDKTKVPRIVNAYFAKKVVTNNGVNPVTVAFEQIPDLPNAGHDATYQIGRRVYIVVETQGMLGQNVELGVKTSDPNLTGTANQLLPLPDIQTIGGTQVQPKYFTTRIIAPNPANAGSWLNVEALNNNQGNSPYANMSQYENKVIQAIKLTPQAELEGVRRTSQALFENWALNLHNAATHNARLTLEVKPSLVNVSNQDQYVYFGQEKFEENAVYAGKGAFSDGISQTFTVENRIVYEVFGDTNAFNYLENTYTVSPRNPAPNYIVGCRIGRVNNSQSTQVVYYYHDLDDNVNEICQCDLVKVRPRANGQTFLIPGTDDRKPGTEANVLVDCGVWAQSGPGPGADSNVNYYYGNLGGGVWQRIVTRDGNDNANVDNTAPDYGYVRYGLLNPVANTSTIELVRMPDNLNVAFNVAGVARVITFDWRNTQRRYANPGCFAAFIGVLGEVNFNDVGSTGMCFADGTSFPSVTHPNGDSIDTAYLGPNLANIDFPREQIILEAFIDWGFSEVIAGSNYTANNELPDAHSHNGSHNDHLHSGNFITTSVEILNP
jgi:hypothetical protein